MKKTSSILYAALLLAGASSAFASSIDLTVTGMITPAACQPSLSSSGIVDFGKIPAKALNQTTPTTLPEQTLLFAVLCDGPTTFALKFKDHQQDSSPHPDSRFGLGKTPDGENIGSYLILLKNPVADSNPTKKLLSLDDGNSWRLGAATPETARTLTAFGDSSSGVWAPNSLTQLVADFLVWGQINPAQDLTLTQEVPVTGNATVELRYL